MKLIDLTVPLDPGLPTYPNNTPFSLEPVKRDGAPARVVLRRT